MNSSRTCTPIWASTGEYFVFAAAGECSRSAPGSAGTKAVLSPGSVSRWTSPDPVYICLGDDQTDESMFSIFPGAWSVLVGNRTPTAARFCVEDPAEAIALLASVLEMLAEQDPVPAATAG